MPRWSCKEYINKKSAWALTKPPYQPSDRALMLRAAWGKVEFVSTSWMELRLPTHAWHQEPTPATVRVSLRVLSPWAAEPLRWLQFVKAIEERNGPWKALVLTLPPLRFVVDRLTAGRHFKMTGSRFTTRFIWHVQAWAFLCQILPCAEYPRLVQICAQLHVNTWRRIGWRRTKRNSPGSPDGPPDSLGTTILMQIIPPPPVRRFRF